MQGAIFQQVSPIQFHSQATRLLPGHGTGMQEQAVNDDNYHDGISPLRLVVSVLANVIGGALFLCGLFILPHVIAGFFG